MQERAKGATPPHVYELTMRESLFHGVQALRLNPVGDGGVYGRDGFLAHPYMLGPNGDSNGWVSVKDYEAFLRVYQNGQIKRLAVVGRRNRGATMKAARQGLRLAPCSSPLAWSVARLEAGWLSMA